MKLNNQIQTLTPSQIDEILKKRFREDGFLNLSKLPNPNLFKDMQRATKRIKSAIDKNEKIIVVGDYDVDGVVSVAILRLFFDEVGLPLDYIIPSRFRHGYGLSRAIFENIQDYNLVITVDNGISSVETAKLCKRAGIDLIITDHHIVPKELPVAYAIVNQKQKECNFPYKDICGAQISWYLIASLNATLNTKIDIRKYLPFVAIATIADIMPLLHINRAMVKFGIKNFIKYNSPPLMALLKLLNKNSIDAQDIAFFIAPLLNSAGRVDDAKYALDFLTSKSLDEATEKLNYLVKFNQKRKEIENKITKEAIESANLDENVLVIEGENWHEGVVGIVASRVGKIYKKPTIILTKVEDNKYKGSGRSFTNCNLFEIVNCSKHLLEKFGGHNFAIGLSLKSENLKEFKSAINQKFIEEQYSNELPDPDILGELDFSYINFYLLEILEKYEPFGEGNRQPKFIANNVTISSIKILGKDGEHKKMFLTKNGITLQAILFRDKREFKPQERVDIIFSIHKNIFKNQVSIQLILEEIKKTN